MGVSVPLTAGGGSKVYKYQGKKNITTLTTSALGSASEEIVYEGSGLILFDYTYLESTTGVASAYNPQSSVYLELDGAGFETMFRGNWCGQLSGYVKKTMYLGYPGATTITNTNANTLASGTFMNCRPMLMLPFAESCKITQYIYDASYDTRAQTFYYLWLAKD